jgi:hypothetical protein
MREWKKKFSFVPLTHCESERELKSVERKATFSMTEVNNLFSRFHKE